MILEFTLMIVTEDRTAASSLFLVHTVSEKCRMWKGTCFTTSSGLSIGAN